MSYANAIDAGVYAILSDLPSFQRAEGLPATGCLMVKMRARVEYRMRVKGNPLRGRGRVETEYTQWGMSGADWQRCVNNALAKATPTGETPREFVAGPRPWGSRLEGTPFVVHTPKGEDNEELYWPMIEWTGQTARRNPDRVLLVDGRPATLEEEGIATSYHIASERHTDATTTTGEVVRLPLLYRSPKVRNIRALQAGGLITIEGANVFLTHKGGERELVGLLPE